MCSVQDIKLKNGWSYNNPTKLHPTNIAKAIFTKNVILEVYAADHETPQ